MQSERTKGYEEYSDTELAAEVRNNSLRAFECLAARYQRQLLGFVSAKIASREDAEEIVQDTLIKCYRHINKYNSRYPFKTWLFTIARNNLISRLRRRETVCEPLQPHQEGSTASSPDREIADSELSELIWRTAHSLPEDQFTVIWMKYREDMDSREISRVVGKSKVNVRVLLHRARKNLARVLSDLS